MLKSAAMSILCLATITACAHPVDSAFRARAEQRQQTYQFSGKISAGACDDAGQFIPSGDNTKIHASASAAPTRD